MLMIEHCVPCPIIQHRLVKRLKSLMSDFAAILIEDGYRIEIDLSDLLHCGEDYSRLSTPNLHIREPMYSRYHPAQKFPKNPFPKRISHGEWGGVNI